MKQSYNSKNRAEENIVYFHLQILEMITINMSVS